MDDGDVQRRFRGDESVRRGWTGSEGICLPDGAWNWINHPRPGPVISSQPHLGDHYICLCMLNILWNYTRQVSKSRLSLYSLSLSLFLSPFHSSFLPQPFILFLQRDRETITITGIPPLCKITFQAKSDQWNTVSSHALFLCTSEEFTGKTSRTLYSRSKFAKFRKISYTRVVFFLNLITCVFLIP